MIRQSVFIGTIPMKNDTNKLSTILKFHKMKYKFKAVQHGPLKR